MVVQLVISFHEMISMMVKISIFFSITCLDGSIPFDSLLNYVRAFLGGPRRETVNAADPSLLDLHDPFVTVAPIITVGPVS